MRNRITKVSALHRAYVSPHPLCRSQHLTASEPSMIFTLILENGRRDSLLYLRVVTVFKLLRLVGQAVEMGPWTYIEISIG